MQCMLILTSQMATLQGLEVSEPGTGPIKAKNRYFVRNIGFLRFGGNTARTCISEPGTGPP